MDHRFVVSSCLLGECCKYNGGHNRNENVIQFLKDKEFISVCPELLGGLPCPRPCCEIKGNKVITDSGKDVSLEFKTGAQIALEKAREFHATCAILQPRSPSCGSNLIYSGDFNNTLIEGNGWFVEGLKEANIMVINANELDQYLLETHKKQ